MHDTYRKIKIRPIAKFYLFFTKFIHKTQLGNIPDLDLIDDLKHKLPYRLVQVSVGRTRTFDNIYDFASYLVEVENNLDIAAENNPRNNSANASMSCGGSNNSSRNSRGSHNTTTTPYTPAGTSTGTITS
jgi:hypothetical protein